MKTAIRLLLISLLLSLCLAELAHCAAAEDLRQMGQRYYRAGYMKEAIACFDGILRIQPR